MSQLIRVNIEPRQLKDLHMFNLLLVQYVQMI
jgi:hypothetical protein